MVRKIVLTAAVALMAVPAFVSAQSTVTATATVGDHMAVTGSGDVAFGTLSRTVDNTIDPTGASAATRTLDYNRNVRVTFDNVPANLTAGALTLPISLTCASRIGAGSWSAATACSSAQFDLDVGAALTQATLGFGGTITAANVATAIAGSYTGTLDIVVVAR
jgi:hypothetical protein